MEEIDISQLINYFKSKLIYVLFAASIAFCLSSIYVNRFRVPEYTNFTTILLNQASDSAALSYNDVNLNKSLIKTYSAIIKSKKVLNQVIEKLDLDLKYEQLVNKVSVGEVTDTTIIRISVIDHDSQLAADIANCIAEVFSEEIPMIYKIENISVIDKAEASDVASSASTIKIIGIATVAGAFVSIAVIFMFFYFDTTLKNEEDIERATGLPVIGIVPVSREKIKYSQHRKYYDDLAKKHKNQEILPIEREVRKIEVSESSEPKPDNEISVGKKVVEESSEEKINVEPNIEDYELDKTIEQEMLNLHEQAYKNKENALNDELSKIKIEALESVDEPVKSTRTRNSKTTASTSKKKYYKKTTSKK